MEYPSGVKRRLTKYEEIANRLFPKKGNVAYISFIFVLDPGDSGTTIFLAKNNCAVTPSGKRSIVEMLEKIDKGEYEPYDAKERL